MMPTWKAAALLPLVFAAGCYQYVPVNHVGLAPATPVSVDLSSRGTINVANKIGENVVAIEGSVTEASESSLTIALLAVRRRGQNDVATWNGESITLSSGDIDEVRQRQLSRSRTAFASTALTAASVGLVVAIAKATGTASGNVVGKPTPNP